MRRTISAVLAATIALAATAITVAAQEPERAGQSAEIWRVYAAHLPIGSTVRVRTNTGERLTAVLFVVDGTGIVVKPKTRVPEPARRVPFDRIEDLSVRQGRISIVKYVGIGAAVGAGVFAWLLTAAMAP